MRVLCRANEGMVLSKVLSLIKDTSSRSSLYRSVIGAFFISDFSQQSSWISVRYWLKKLLAN